MMPVPANIEASQGALKIDGGFTVGVCGTRSIFVTQAVARVKQLTAETGLILPYTKSPAEFSKATLVIAESRTIVLPQLSDHETYTRQVSTQ